METCGYCRGAGRQPGPTRDAYGPRPDYPETVCCDYCGGSGRCEDGGRLLAAPERERPRDDTLGVPAWG